LKLQIMRQFDVLSMKHFVEYCVFTR
jgi:hypothetical protein